MMRVPHRLVGIIVLLVLGLVLAACAADEPAADVADEPPEAEPEAPEPEAPEEEEEEPEAAEPEAPEPEEVETATVRLAALPLANYTIFLAAEEQGYLDEEGIELDITYVAQGAVALEALIGGSVDVVFPAHLEFVQAASVHDNLRILMGWTRLPDDGPDNTAFLTLEDSGIETVADLEGQRLAAGLLHSINHFYTEIWLEQHGVDPGSVTFAEVPFPNMRDALDNNQVDAVYSVEPFTTLMESAGGYHSLGHPYMEVNPGFTIITPTVRQEWLDANPDVAERLVRAFEQGAAYLRDAGEDERVRLVSAFTEIDEGLVANMRIPIFDTAVRVDTVQRTADLALERGVIDEAVDVDALLADTASRE